MSAAESRDVSLTVQQAVDGGCAYMSAIHSVLKDMNGSVMCSRQ